MAKVIVWILRLSQIILLFMRLILLLMNFSRTIRAVNIILLFMSYFLIYA
jgi:hypothetical protein